MRSLRREHGADRENEMPAEMNQLTRRGLADNTPQTAERITF
jgi:hypothetical protein